MMQILVKLIPHITGWFLGFVTALIIAYLIERRPLTNFEIGIMILGSFLGCIFFVLTVGFF